MKIASLDTYCLILTVSQCSCLILTVFQIIIWICGWNMMGKGNMSHSEKVNFIFSGTTLIRPTLGHENVVVITGGRITEVVKLSK